MKCNEWAELICAVISLLVTAIIGMKQYCQSKRMEEFERRQDERDERRHAEGNKAQAVEFISKRLNSALRCRRHAQCSFPLFT